MTSSVAKATMVIIIINSILHIISIHEQLLLDRFTSDPCYVIVINMKRVTLAGATSRGVSAKKWRGKI
jgi:hypothetical protein